MPPRQSTLLEGHIGHAPALRSGPKHKSRLLPPNLPRIEGQRRTVGGLNKQRVVNIFANFRYKNNAK